MLTTGLLQLYTGNNNVSNINNYSNMTLTINNFVPLLFLRLQFPKDIFWNIKIRQLRFSLKIRISILSWNLIVEAYVRIPSKQVTFSIITLTIYVS